RCASCGHTVDHGHWVEIDVTDSGSGISPEVMQSMFEPFFTTKEVGRGSGMGLAMVHGIVHEHGGHLLVDTALGRGASFRVLIPADDGSRASEPGRPPTVARDDNRLAGRVLVVEDEGMVGDFMAELLGG